MLFCASSRLSSCLASGKDVLSSFKYRSYADLIRGATSTIPPSILGLESTFKLCRRGYVTVQKHKKPSSRRLKGLKPRDPYAANQAEQRRAANISRQTVLREERARAMGDPIRGVTTPFIESLDTGLDSEAKATVTTVTEEPSFEDSSQPASAAARAGEKSFLNHYLTKGELEEALQYSKKLTEPLVEQDRAVADTMAEAEAAREHASNDKTAREAVSRIVSLGNASSKERTRANVRRIIDTFGRHKTDQQLKPKAPSRARLNATMSDADQSRSEKVAGTQPSNADKKTQERGTEKGDSWTGILTPSSDALDAVTDALKSTSDEEWRKPRAGPDTGSSEVQIGLLTAKIRILADRYEGENRNDKVNKRNLRLLLHRRQKLLKYMEKKERGSGRWQNMIEKLGLTEATWKGEIAVQ